MKRNSFLLSTLLSLFGFSSCNCQNWTDMEPDEFEKEAFDAKTSVIDVRTASEYAEGHLYRAVNIDWQKDGFMDEISTARSSGFPRKPRLRPRDTRHVPWSTRIRWRTG